MSASFRQLPPCLRVCLGARDVGRTARPVGRVSPAGDQLVGVQPSAPDELVPVRIPLFLACRDLAVFKAFFDRTKDWADLEEMQGAGTLDIEVVAGVLVRYLGTDDPRIARLLALG
jgi:hypothetical protein